MKRSTKITLWTLGLGGAAALVAGVAMASEGEGFDWGGGGAGGLGSDDDPYAGPGAGGQLDGRTIDGALRNFGRLPPGAILLSGDNVVGRGAAIAILEGKAPPRVGMDPADYGIVANRKLLDEQIDDEQLPGADISSASLVVAGVSPDGQMVRTVIVPPRDPAEVPAAIDDIIEFAGAKKKA